MASEHLKLSTSAYAWTCRFRQSSASLNGRSQGLMARFWKVLDCLLWLRHRVLSFLPRLGSSFWFTRHQPSCRVLRP